MKIAKNYRLVASSDYVYAIEKKLITHVQISPTSFIFAGVLKMWERGREDGQNQKSINET